MIFASPYVLAGAHPQIVYAAYLANALRPKIKAVATVFSYGWGGRGDVQIREMLSGLKAKFLDPVLVKGLPKETDRNALLKIVEEIGIVLSDTLS